MHPLAKSIAVSLLALVVPAVLVWFGAAAFAATSTTSSSSSTSSGQSSSTGGGATAGVAGNPAHGQQLYSQNCAQCHGQQLEGGVGPKLNPIAQIDQVSKPLDPKYLTNTITNGKQGELGQMPAKGGNQSLTAQDVQDLVAFIIQQNKTNTGTVSQHELAVSVVQMVTLGILSLLVLTYLLSRYNMRWISRRARP